MQGTMMNRRLWTILTLTSLLAGCGASDPSFVRLGDYENDAGAAVVRQLIQTLPELAPGVPKEYCIVKALDLRATDMEFTHQFQDLKLLFVSRDVLGEQEDTHFPMNPKSGLSPIMLQIGRMKKLSAEAYEVEAAWAYKREFERKRFQTELVGGQWKVTELETLDSYRTPVAK
jgi:hypothetical protein